MLIIIAVVRDQLWLLYSFKIIISIITDNVIN